MLILPELFFLLTILTFNPKRPFYLPLNVKNIWIYGKRFGLPFFYISIDRADIFLVTISSAICDALGRPTKGPRLLVHRLAA